MAIVTTFVDNMSTIGNLDTQMGVIQNVLDFSKTNVSSGDVVQALKVPVDSLVINVSSFVITAEGATCTATLGDGDGAAEWKNSINLNSAIGHYAVAGTDDYCFGKFYKAADTIDLTMGHDTDAAKILVVATISNLVADLA